MPQLLLKARTSEMVPFKQSKHGVEMILRFLDFAALLQGQGQSEGWESFSAPSTERPGSHDVSDGWPDVAEGSHTAREPSQQKSTATSSPMPNLGWDQLDSPMPAAPASKAPKKPPVLAVEVNQPVPLSPAQASSPNSHHTKISWDAWAAESSQPASKPAVNGAGEPRTAQASSPNSNHTKISWDAWAAESSQPAVKGAGKVRPAPSVKASERPALQSAQDATGNLRDPKPSLEESDWNIHAFSPSVPAPSKVPLPPASRISEKGAGHSKPTLSVKLPDDSAMRAQGATGHPRNLNPRLAESSYNRIPAPPSSAAADIPTPNMLGAPPGKALHFSSYASWSVIDEVKGHYINKRSASTAHADSNREEVKSWPT